MGKMMCYTSASYVTHVTSRVLHAMMSRVLCVFRARYFHQQGLQWMFEGCFLFDFVFLLLK